MFFSRFPKVWKAEITVGTTGKQGWIARCMILCSRITWLPLIKYAEANDATSDKQNSDVKSSDAELDNSKVFFSSISVVS